MTERIQAILLLTAPLGERHASEAKPLSSREWASVARWLRSEGLEPESFLAEQCEEVLSRWKAREEGPVSADRLRSLLTRSAALGLSLERWERAGLWALTRSDPRYPGRLKDRLGDRAPSVLFGCGDPDLLRSRGVAVVGARDAVEDDLDFARDLGSRAAAQGFSIISGDARGVDRSAMSGALEEGGPVVGVLPGDLLRESASRAHRERLAAGGLVLVSPFPPESRWEAWRAMDRNKHIYCLAEAGVVVRSAIGEGGTWAGAMEAIDAGWLPIWLHQNGGSASEDRGRDWWRGWLKRSGNVALAERGGHWLPEKLEDLDCLFEHPEASVTIRPQGSRTPYEAFLDRLEELTRQNPLSVDEITKSLAPLRKEQAASWVRKGVKGGAIREAGPSRYRYAPGLLET